MSSMTMPLPASCSQRRAPRFWSSVRLHACTIIGHKHPYVIRAFEGLSMRRGLATRDVLTRTKIYGARAYIWRNVSHRLRSAGRLEMVPRKSAALDPAERNRMCPAKKSGPVRALYDAFHRLTPQCRADPGDAECSLKMHPYAKSAETVLWSLKAAAAVDLVG